MAHELEGQVEQALCLVFFTTAESNNMRKALRQKILETGSNITTLFVKMKASGDRNTSERNNLTKQVDKLRAEFKQCKKKKHTCIIRHFPQEQLH